jgi:ATP-dependent exoDNAse (exonuclease V) alpha subunit
LGFYLDHDRVHVGDTTTCVDNVFQAWQHEQAQGRECVMLAPTRDLVAELNARARTERLTSIGASPDTQVRLGDGNQASAGDIVITRRNDRRLSISATDWVKNGDRWTITNVHNDGALSVRHTVSGLTAILPAAYVAVHVDLGYASTVHTAQGLTADVMHGIITGHESRQLLYTMLTRGRHENHIHVLLHDTSDNEPRPVEATELQTATEIIENVLRRDGAATSATTTATIAASPAKQLHDAVARYDDAVHAAAEHLLGADRVTRVCEHAERLIPDLTSAQ